jgi:hypothetical protein
MVTSKYQSYFLFLQANVIQSSPFNKIEALQVMARYVRNQFTDPAPGVTAAVRLQAKQRSQSAIKGKVIGNTVKRKIVRKAFYSDEEVC